MKRIIIVDDDPGVQDAFTFIFDPAYYEVIIYPDGHTILNNQYTVPDLFILDKQLSGVDGLDICRYLKSQAAIKHIPVIMLSASPNIHQLAQEAGANDALEKPFTVQSVREMAGKYLR